MCFKNFSTSILLIIFYDHDVLEWIIHSHVLRPYDTNGENFSQIFIFYDKWWVRNFWAKKLNFHVELERYFLNLCSAYLEVIFF